MEVWVQSGSLFELGTVRITGAKGIVELEQVQELVEILVLINYICVTLEEGDIQYEP